MTRISLIDAETNPELADALAAFQARRATGSVYRMLLHSPAIANAWFNLNNALRDQMELDAKLAEIAIIRVLKITRGAYLLSSHVPKIALERGLTIEQCEALDEIGPSPLFDAREDSVIAYADAITNDIRVPDAVFDAVRAHFSERQILELTVVIGAYNMHSRVFEALELAPPLTDKLDHKVRRTGPRRNGARRQVRAR